MIMQSAFFKLAAIIPETEAVEYLKDSIKKAYGKKGEKVVNMNFEAVEAGLNALVKIDVPANWSNAEELEMAVDSDEPEFIKNILRPMNAQEGNNLPVSAFEGLEDGTFPAGTAACCGGFPSAPTRGTAPSCTASRAPGRADLQQLSGSLCTHCRTCSSDAACCRYT